MDLISGEYRNLPSSNLSYEEFAVDADQTFEQAVREIEEAPSFNWRKRKGEMLRRKAQGKVTGMLYPAIGMVTGALLGITKVGLPENPAGAVISLGSFMGNGVFAGMAYDQAKTAVNGRLGSFLEDRSGYTQIRSGQIGEIKSELSDPDDRPKNVYAADFDGYTEIHSREGIEDVMDSLAEQYTEAMWAVARDEENPFQVIGMTLEDRPKAGYDEKEYDQRRKLAEETVEALGSGSVKDVLSTEEGGAPTSPRYEDREFDVIIVDRNPEQRYNEEDNFFDYSENLDSRLEPAEESEELQGENKILKNQD